MMKWVKQNKGEGLADAVLFAQLSLFFPNSIFLFVQVRQAVAEGNCCFGTIDTWLLFKLTKGAFGLWNFFSAVKS